MKETSTLLILTESSVVLFLELHLSLSLSSVVFDYIFDRCETWDVFRSFSHGDPVCAI